MITEKATYYLVYAALVVITFLIDNLLLKKSDKTSRTVGYILSIIVDLAMFGYGIYLYKAKGEDQTGFVVCACCAYWAVTGRTRKTTKETKGHEKIGYHHFDRCSCRG